MGVFHTESWGRFARGQLNVFGAGKSSWSIIAGKEYSVRTTYGAYGMISDLSLLTAGLNKVGIYEDPMMPVKNRIGTDKLQAGSTSSPFAFSFQKNFSSPKNHYYVGALIRFNSGSAKEANKSQAFNRLSAVSFTTNDAEPYAVTGNVTLRRIVPNPASSLFMASDSTNTGTTVYNEPPRSYLNNTALVDPLVSLGYDKDHFVEIEVNKNDSKFRVWVDDIIIIDAPWTAEHNKLINGFSFWIGLAGSGVGPNTDAGGIMISDIYCIDATDGVEPVVRLGPTTRVWCDKPENDVKVDFNRPASYPSNASLVSASISTPDSPIDYLAAEGAGSEDLYSSSNNLNVLASKIHAVNVRSIFANSGLAEHDIGGVVADPTGTVSKVKSYGSTVAADGYVSRQAVFHTDETDAIWTPNKAVSTTFGFKIIS